MKPLYLRFKGINSFSEQAEIDFEKLTKSGIFGIFGDTGSGKSTILDCISFALYGKVERSKEKLDIINYKSDGAEVRFDFEAQQGGKRKKFTVERSIKKKSGVHKAALYEDGLSIADNPSTVSKKIADILGVNAEDFSKCIALPQGEFSQFVKSNPSDRIALIERLFSLSRYGDRLKEKIRDRERESEINYKTLAAKIELYADVSEEILKASVMEREELIKQKTALLKENAKAEKLYQALNKLSEKKEELDKVLKEIEEQTVKAPQMEILRKSVALAPIFKAAAELNKELESKKKEFANAEAKEKESEKELSLGKARLQDLNAVEKKADFENRIAELIKKDAAIQALEGKPEKLSLLDKLLTEKRTAYKKLAEIREKKEKDLSRAQDELSKLEQRLKSLGQSNIEDIIDIDFKGAHLKGEYEYALDYFSGLKGQIEFFKDNGEFWKFIERELKSKIGEYKDRVETIRDFGTERAKNKLKEYLSFGSEREKLISEINAKRAEIQSLNVDLDLNKRDTESLTSDGERERREYNELKAALDKVYGKDCTDYKNAKAQNTRYIKELRAEKENLSARLEKESKKLTELESESAVNKSKLSILKEDISVSEKKLLNILKDGGFETFEDLGNINKEVEFENIGRELKSYDEKNLLLQSRKAELEKTDGLNEFSSESLKSAFENKNKISEELNLVNEKIAVSDAFREKCEKRLIEKKELTKDFKIVERERDLISQLKEITRGNNFMEFIANEYLSGIASLASSTLLTLTDGRYFLKYTDTFYAGDNYNLGNLRGVNTLSGGETFLVSLSLALALSKTICSSLKSIEFFFLDEGFGTLDSSLVDTVMTALEKLKGEHFTIGVISHVEELKHRIDNKIIVNKSTETHGSYVQTSF